MASPIPFCGNTPCNALPAIQVPVQEASGAPVSENSSMTLHELLTILRRRGRLSPGMSRDDLLKEVLRIAPDVGLAMDLADLILIKKRSEPEIHAGWRSEGAMPPARSNAPSVSLGDAANDPESAAIVKGSSAPAPRAPEAIKTNIPSPQITPTAMGTGSAASAPKATGTPIGGLIGKGWPEPPGFMAPVLQKKQEVSSILHPHETSQHEVHGPVNAGHTAYLDALKKEKLGHYQDWHESTGSYVERMPKSGNVAAAKRGGMVDPEQLYGPPGKQHSEQLGKHLEEFLARGLYHLAEKHKNKPAALATRIGHLTDLLESHKLGHGEHGKLLGHYLEGDEHTDPGDKFTEPTTTKYPGGQNKEYMQGHKDLYESHIEQLHKALNALDEKLTASDPDAVARKKERDKAGETPQPWKSEHPEDEPSWKTRANPLSTQKDIDALHDHFESKSPREYRKAKPYVDRVVANLPANVIDSVRTNTSGGMKVYDSASDVHDSFMSIYDEGVKNKGWPKVDWGRGKIGGFYVATDGGSLHIAKLVKDGNDYTDHAIAHEMAHAVDGPGYQLSSREAFRTAWDREIVHGGNVSKYAAKNPREGFAEFARCVWSGNVDKETLWRDTPQLMKFFEFHGLLPDDMGMKEGSQGKKSFAKDRDRVKVEEIFKDSVSLPDGTTGDIFLDDDSKEKGKSDKNDIKTEE